MHPSQIRFKKTLYPHFLSFENSTNLFLLPFSQLFGFEAPEGFLASYRGENSHACAHDSPPAPGFAVSTNGTWGGLGLTNGAFMVVNLLIMVVSLGDLPSKGTPK